MPMKSMIIRAAAVAIAPIFSAPAQTLVVPMPSGRAATEYYTNLPQADPGDDSANWSAQQNVLDSRRYEQLVRTNPSFRAARIRLECGPIADPDLFKQCVATFEY